MKATQNSSPGIHNAGIIGITDDSAASPVLRDDRQISALARAEDAITIADKNTEFAISRRANFKLVNSDVPVSLINFSEIARNFRSTIYRKHPDKT